MKRDIFSELIDGINVLADIRRGNVTPLTQKVKITKSSLLSTEESRIFAAREYSGYICPEYMEEGTMIVVPLAEAKTICLNSSMTQPPGRSLRLPSMVEHLRAWFPWEKFADSESAQ